MRLQARGYHYPITPRLIMKPDGRQLARKFEASSRNADDFVIRRLRLQINNIKRVQRLSVRGDEMKRGIPGVRKATARARSAVTAVARYVTRHVRKNERILGARYRIRSLEPLATSTSRSCFFFYRITIRAAARLNANSNLDCGIADHRVRRIRMTLQPARISVRDYKGMRVRGSIGMTHAIRPRRYQYTLEEATAGGNTPTESYLILLFA